jgi:hypothetical protein
MVADKDNIPVSVSNDTFPISVDHMAHDRLGLRWGILLRGLGIELFWARDQGVHAKTRRRKGET